MHWRYHATGRIDQWRGDKAQRPESDQARRRLMLLQKAGVHSQYDWGESLVSSKSTPLRFRPSAGVAFLSCPSSDLRNIVRPLIARALVSTPAEDCNGNGKLWKMSWTFNRRLLSMTSVAFKGAEPTTDPRLKCANSRHAMSAPHVYMKERTSAFAVEIGELTAGKLRLPTGFRALRPTLERRLPNQRAISWLLTKRLELPVMLDRAEC